MNVYKTLLAGVDEVINAKKYKSINTRRVDLCNRYNSAIATVLQSENLTSAGRARIKGLKGLITKSIVDTMNEEELKLYVDNFVRPIVSDFFGRCEI